MPTIPSHCRSSYFKETVPVCQANQVEQLKVIRAYLKSL